LLEGSIRGRSIAKTKLAEDYPEKLAFTLAQVMMTNEIQDSANDQYPQDAVMPPSPPPPKSDHKWLYIGLIILGIVLLVLFIVLIYYFKNSNIKKIK
jgi:hypothetical protein